MFSLINGLGIGPVSLTKIIVLSLSLSLGTTGVGGLLTRNFWCDFTWYFGQEQCKFGHCSLSGGIRSLMYLDGVLVNLAWSGSYTIGDFYFYK